MPPAALIESATLFVASSCKSPMPTAAPAFARARAVASPIPDAAPVTMTVLPVKLKLASREEGRIEILLISEKYRRTGGLSKITTI